MDSTLRDLIDPIITGFADSKGLSIAWPNVEFNNENLSSYLEISFLPLTPDVIGLCNGLAIWGWVINIEVHILKGTGEYLATDLIDAMRSELPVNKVLNGSDLDFRVISPLAAIPPITINGWHTTPVQCRIQTIR